MWGWALSGSSRSSGCFSAWGSLTRMSGRIEPAVHFLTIFEYRPAQITPCTGLLRSSAHARPVSVKKRPGDEPGGAALAEDLDLGLQPVPRALGRDEGKGDGFARVVRIAARGAEPVHFTLDPDRFVAIHIGILRLHLKSDERARSPLGALDLCRRAADEISVLGPRDEAVHPGLARRVVW